MTHKIFQRDYLPSFPIKLEFDCFFKKKVVIFEFAAKMSFCFAAKERPSNNVICVTTKKRKGVLFFFFAPDRLFL